MEVFGGPEVLRVQEVPEQEPGSGQVRVALRAAGVNPAEAYIRTGTYAFFRPDLPYTPGFDGAGTIDALGPDVSGFSVGDRVYVSSILSAYRTGTYAEQVVCTADAVHPLNDELSFAQGAAVGLPATTAYRALFQRAAVRPGETVLVHGASGGVGSSAVQLAAGAGITVIGTAGSPAGMELVSAAGADHVLDHTDAGHLAAVVELTNGRGPDVIVEMLADRNLAADLDAIAMYGRVVVVGSRGSLDFSPRATMVKEADIRGMALWNTPSADWAEASAGVAAALAAGDLVPVVGRSYPLDAAADAQRDLLETRAKGKIVLEF
jgi:NADPH2:quinone reductase